MLVILIKIDNNWAEIVATNPENILIYCFDIIYLMEIHSVNV
jgi:hypothetical protein